MSSEREMEIGLIGRLKAFVTGWRAPKTEAERLAEAERTSERAARLAEVHRRREMDARRGACGE